MTKSYILSAILLLLLPFSVVHANPAAKTKFQADLAALTRAATETMGFDSLKGTELARGEWTCKLELEGFLTTIKEKENDPRGILYISAASVSPVAYKYANMLALNGLKGYTMRDSDKDRTVAIDKSTTMRKLIFSRREKYVTVTITVLFVAHEDNAVQINIDAR